MDIFALGIPNITVKNIGTKRDPLEIVEATIRLEAWDGYLTKRWENAREIADGTIKLHFACNSRSQPEDWEMQVNAYHYVLQHQHAIRDSIVRALIEKFELFRSASQQLKWLKDRGSGVRIAIAVLFKARVNLL